ncbi:hypothetical protein AALO_G00118930 [Alosa alosa]|uniref:Uncharacterized protein n=1 Tax=Alosa alosa TaxID=278164 RepID=A0AAV6GQV9_9TELE|nr:hypothetical protein AALO_G00118930 [Alosa alosa]
MKSGHELRILTSYIDLLYPTDDRNERLRDAYFFTCNCKECSSRAKQDEQKLRLRKLSEAPPPEQVRTAHATSIMGVHQGQKRKRYPYTVCAREKPGQGGQVCRRDPSRLDWGNES